MRVAVERGDAGIPALPERGADVEAAGIPVAGTMDEAALENGMIAP